LSERDDLVRREKESRFGFKLFMRVFALAFAYHSDASAGSQSLSFDSLSVGALRSDKAKPHLDEILDSTVEVLSAVAMILRNRLYCDDFRMLPETSSLWPIFQLLIRFPRLAATAEDQVAAVILRLMLADLRRDQLLRLVKRVTDALDSQQALEAFDNGKLEHRAVAGAIDDGVDDAQSLTNRYVLLMYWLLRRRRAKDFSYDANLDDPEVRAKLRKKYGVTTEPEIGERVKPEKQHVVPHSALKKIFRHALTGPRLGRHEAHNVGNLTYISQLENGWEGISSTPLKLRQEDPANLEAHFLDGSEILDAFDACRESATPAHFREFCRLRRDRIRQAFVEWDMEFRSLPVSMLPPETPVPRLIEPTPEDRIWLFGYQKPIPSLLLQMWKRGFRPEEPRDREDFALRLVLKDKNRSRASVNLFPGGREIRCKIKDDNFKTDWKSRFPDIPVDDKKSRLKGTLSLTDDSSIRVAVGVLEWLRDSAPEVAADGRA
jgi:hypothetical protein